MWFTVRICVNRPDEEMLRGSTRARHLCRAFGGGLGGYIKASQRYIVCL